MAERVVNIGEDLYTVVQKDRKGKFRQLTADRTMQIMSKRPINTHPVLTVESEERRERLMETEKSLKKIIAAARQRETRQLTAEEAHDRDLDELWF